MRRVSLPRKEVIQPHVPVRLPCYDFTPITDPTLVVCFPRPGGRGLARRLRVLVERLDEDELRASVNEHWTVAAVFGHIAFWDARVLYTPPVTPRKPDVLEVAGLTRKGGRCRRYGR